MNEKIFVVCFLILFALLSWAGIQDIPGPGGDNARYIILAQSLSSGKGASLINFPGEPLDTVIPPLYPSFLASLIMIFGFSVFLCNLSSLFLMVSSLGIFYLLMRRLKIPLEARVLTFLFIAFNPLFLEYSREAFIEAFFIFFTISAVYFFCRFEHSIKHRFLYMGLAAVIFAVLTRYIGIVALFPLPIILLMKRKYKSFFVFSSAGLLLAAYCFLSMLRSFPSGYLGEFMHKGNYLHPSSEYIDLTALLRRYTYETAAYIGDVLPDFICPLFRAIPPHTQFWAVKIGAGLLFLMVMAYGYVRMWGKRTGKYILLFPFMYAFLLPIFPTYGIRYVAPIGMIMLLLFIYGIMETGLPRKHLFFAVFIFLFMFSSLSVSAVELAKIHAGFSPEWASFHRSLLYIRDRKLQEGVVMCRKPFSGYLVSGHKTIAYPYLDDPQAMFDYIMKSGARYLILDNLDIAGIRFSRKYLLPAVRLHQVCFTPLYTAPDTLTTVYQIDNKL